MGSTWSSEASSEGVDIPSMVPSDEGPCEAPASLSPESHIELELRQRIDICWRLAQDVPDEL
jgi:hypothetical protein